MKRRVKEEGKEDSLSSQLTPARRSNSTSLSDPESALAEARTTSRWRCRPDPCSRPNFRRRRARGTRVPSAVGLCSRSVNERKRWSSIRVHRVQITRCRIRSVFAFGERRDSKRLSRARERALPSWPAFPNVMKKIIELRAMRYFPNMSTEKRLLISFGREKKKFFSLRESSC